MTGPETILSGVLLIALSVVLEMMYRNPRRRVRCPKCGGGNVAERGPGSSRKCLDCNVWFSGE